MNPPPPPCRDWDWEVVVQAGRTTLTATQGSRDAAAPMIAPHTNPGFPRRRNSMNRKYSPFHRLSNPEWRQPVLRRHECEQWAGKWRGRPPWWLPPVQYRSFVKVRSGVRVGSWSGQAPTPCHPLHYYTRPGNSDPSFFFEFLMCRNIGNIGHEKMRGFNFNNCTTLWYIKGGHFVLKVLIADIKHIGFIISRAQIVLESKSKILITDWASHQTNNVLGTRRDLRDLI